MGININYAPFGLYGVNNIKQNTNINRTRSVTFLGEDVFENNSPLSFCDEEKLNSLVKSNPKVTEILNQNNIPLKYNIIELKELFENHCLETQKTAINIVDNLPPAVKQMADIPTLKIGAMYHDFGKVLIPAEILNKPARLTPEEHKIMDLHPVLGYEMLKNSGLDEKVLKLVKEHHNRTIFPPDINVQILNLADMYSALTEKRAYKEAYSPQKALTIIYSEVKKNNINPIIFNALVKSVNGAMSPTAAQ